MEQYRYWLALKEVAGIGNILYKRLIDTFKTPEAVFAADEEALSMVEGISEGVAGEIIRFSDFSKIDQELEKITRAKTTLLSLSDPTYPTLLAAIYDPPPLLYVKGTLDYPTLYPLAVVGTRKPTYYGRMVTEKITRMLVERGILIVSGLAKGIDGFSHRAALSAGGKTIAVLGSGLNQIYPREHKRLADEVSEQGGLLSEFSMDTEPLSHHFPQRNRIISGLSLGCLVTEASLASGSLITAQSAVEQGREVFAIPGSIFSPTSVGTHRLIRSGAKLVERVEDILEEILPQLKRPPASVEKDALPLEEEEAKLYQILSYDPKHIDQVSEEIHWGVSSLASTLLAMELKGVIRQLAGQFYVRG